MKRAQVIWFRAKPLLWCFGITFLLTALFRLLPINYYILFCGVPLFFLYGVLSFRYQTDLYLQFGVSRVRQIGSIFALVPICVLSGVLCALLPLLYERILPNSEVFYSGFSLFSFYIAFPEQQAVWWVAAHFSLQNILALFVGCFLGVLLYMRPKNNRVTAAIVTGIALLLCGGAAVAYRYAAVYYFHAYEKMMPHSDTELFLQGFIRNILLGMHDGDGIILGLITLLLWSTLFAAGTCLFLRKLSQR